MSGDDRAPAARRRRPACWTWSRRGRRRRRGRGDWSGTGTHALTRFANRLHPPERRRRTHHVRLRVRARRPDARRRLDDRPTTTGSARWSRRRSRPPRAAPGRSRVGRGSPPPAPAPEVEHWDDATAAADAGRRGRPASRAFVDAAGGLETAGFCSTTRVTPRFANTAGQRLIGAARRRPTIDGIARTGPPTGCRGVAASRARGPRRRRARRAGGGQGPGRRRTRSTSSPAATRSSSSRPRSRTCWRSCSFHGFNGKAVEEGRSFVELGEAQFDPSITLRDDVDATRRRSASRSTSRGRRSDASTSSATASRAGCSTTRRTAQGARASRAPACGRGRRRVGRARCEPRVLGGARTVDRRAHRRRGARRRW